MKKLTVSWKKGHCILYINTTLISYNCYGNKLIQEEPYLGRIDHVPRASNVVWWPHLLPKKPRKKGKDAVVNKVYCRSFHDH